MKIEHIAMYVNELETARDFFISYLGGKSNDGYHIREDMETPPIPVSSMERMNSLLMFI